jgi:hypothetical protein
VTVENLIRLFVHNKSRDRYQLNSLGSGCRFWCLTAVKDLEEAGYIAQGSGRDVESGIGQLHRAMGNQWVPYPLIQGSFY